MRRQMGFTLIEVMIVVAIVAIIAAFAYPSYQDSVRKSRRADAKQALTDLAARMEQYYISNKSYTTTVANVGLSTATSPEGYYTLSVAAGPTTAIATSYTLTAAATSKGNQNADTACATMTLNSVGTRTPSTGCW